MRPFAIGFVLLWISGTILSVIASPPTGSDARNDAAKRLGSRERQALKSREALLKRAAAANRRAVAPRSLPSRAGKTDVSRTTPGMLKRKQSGPQLGTGRLGREAVSKTPGLLRKRHRRTHRNIARKRRDIKRSDTNPGGDDGSDETTRPDHPNAKRIRHAHAHHHIHRHADRLLAKRLAHIDHLRDVAVENGNMKLLDRADELERIARAQFARRTGHDGEGDIIRPTGFTPTFTPGQRRDAEARQDGREFGHSISDLARQGGRHFGHSKSEGPQLLPTTTVPDENALTELRDSPAIEIDEQE